MSHPFRHRAPFVPSCAMLLAVVGVSGLWAGGARAAALTWTGATADMTAAANWGGTAPAGNDLTWDATGTTQTGLTGTINGSSYTVSGASNYGISGILQGAGATLTKEGSGTLTLSGANSYGGGTTISAGTLQLNNTTGAGSGTITLGDSNTGANNVQLTLNAANIANNVVVANQGSGTVTLYATSQFQSQTGTTAISRDTTFQTFDAGGGDWWYAWGAISGTGNVTFKAGAADNASRTILSATNTYVGKTTIAQGRMQVQNTSAFGDSGNELSLQGTGRVNLRSNLNIGALTGSGAGMYADVSSTLTLGNGGGSGAFSGALVNGAGVFSLTKTGAGTQILSGANTYTGATTVTGGTLVIKRVGTGSSNVNVTGGAQLTTSAINVSGGALAILDMGPGIKFASANAKTTLGGAGTIRVASGLWYLGNGSGAGGGSAVSMSAGGLIDVLSGATLSNDYANAVWTANQASLNVASGGTMDVRNNNTFVDALTGGGLVTNSAGSNTLTVGVAGGSGTFSGAIQNGTGIALTKNGAGTQTLTGANTYTGATTINGGTLQISGSGTLGGGSYAGNITDNAALVFASSSNQTLSGQITGTGSLTQSGNSTLTLSNATQTFAGPLTVTRGAVNVTTATGISSNAWNIGVNYGATAPAATGVLAFTASQDLTGKTLSTFTASGAEASSTPYLNAILALKGGNTGALTVTAPVVANQSIVRVGNTYFLTNSTQTSYIWSGAATGNPIADGAGTWDASTTAQWRDVNSGTTTNATWAGGANIANFGVASGAAGAVAVSGTVNAGGLAFSPSASGAYTLSGGTINFGSNNGVLAANGTNATVNSQISGSNGLTKYGAGTITLGGNNNAFTGGATISGGTLQLTHVSGVGSGTITLGDANTGTGSVRLLASVGSGNFSNAITVSASGAGTATIEQSVNYSTLSGLITLNRATTITSSAGDRTGISGKITGNVGTLTFTGGRTTLDNTVANDFVGNVVIASGSLQTNVANALPTNASVTVLGSGVFQLNNGFSQSIDALIGGTAGTVGVQIIAAGPVTLTLGSNGGSGTFAGIIQNGASALSMTKTGTGTQTFSGANTYTGLTTVDAGVLQVDINNALGTAAGKTTVSNGATLQLNYVNYATAETLDITGTGVGGTAGALSNIGTSTYAGRINVLAGSTGGATINVGGGTLTLTGGVDKDGTVLTLTGGGTINVNSVISGISDDSDLVVDGTTANLNAANTYNGPTFIRSNATQGVLNANVAGALPTPVRSHLTMDDSGAGGSLLNLGASQEVASLTGAGTSLVTLNAHNLTLGATAGSTTFAGAISGSGQIIKDGASTQVLSGINTYTGDTTVSAGTLVVGGAGQLGGGNYAGDVIISDIAVLNLDTSAAQTLAGTYLFDVDYGALGTGDENGALIDITGAGAVDISAMTFDLGTASGSTQAGENYRIKILEWSGADPVGAVADGANVVVAGLGANQTVVRHGNAYYLVPEPASFALLGLGSLLLLRRPTRRRGRKAQP